MIRKLTLLLISCLCVNYAAKAQFCGSEKVHQQQMATNPSYVQKYNQFNATWQSWMASQSNPSALLITLPGGDSVYEIPVVVHIVYPGPAYATPGSGNFYNPSDATVQAWIDYTNQVWAASWSMFPPDGSGGTRIPIRFALAKRDPNCNATTGIIRVDGSSVTDYNNNGVDHGTIGADEEDVKDLSRWPNTDYYNIWVVHKFDGVDGLPTVPPTPITFLAGFAYFPGASAALDGTMILSRQFTVGTVGSNITLAHEFGHAFNLEHTFKGGCAASSGSPGCTADGDFCCDTEPMAQGGPSTCPANNTGTGCPGTPFTMNTQNNIMNYSNCQDRFTPNQRDRVLLALKNARPTLISSLGATALPSSAMPAVCVPTYANPGSPQNAGPTRVNINYGTSPLLDVSSGGYITEGNKVYVDNTCKYGVNLVAGETYAIRCTTINNTQVAKVYIDLNNDGILGNSAGETIPLTRTGTLHSANYTVPIAGHVAGCIPLRMRVVADQAGNVDSCGPLQYGQAEDYMVTILGSSGGASSITITNPPTGGNPSCLGSTIILNTTKTGNPTVVNHAWFRKPAGGGVAVPGPSCATCSTWTSNAFLNLDTVWVVMTYQSACGATDTMSNKLVLNRPLTINPSVNIGVVYGSFPSCIDDSISIGVTSNSNPGGSPAYQWRVNGSPVGSPNAGPTFDATGLAEGTVISVVMTSSAAQPCAPPPPNNSVVSNNIIIDTAIKNPSVTLALIAGTNPGCSGQLLSFKALPVVGGTSPAFQWFKNGSLVTGVTGDTYTSVFNDNDQVYVRITSNSPCAPLAPNNTATSSTVTITHIQLTADITISQISGTNPACSGKKIGFAANATNTGANPSYQWLLNGALINGANGTTYITDSLKNNDIISCVLLATDPCVLNPQDTSNAITMTVIQSKIPSANISITQGKNPGCLDSLVCFTAIANDIGNNPLYIWKINGFDVSSGTNVYCSSSFLNGDQVSSCVIQTDGGCYLPDTVCSNVFNMVRSATPDPPLIHFIGNKLVTHVQPGSYIWFGPAGEENIGGEDGNFLPPQPGFYYAVTNNNGCWSKPSNVLKVILLDINTLDFEGMKVYPNPTTGKLIIEWDRQVASLKLDVYNLMGQVVVRDQMQGTSHKELDLSPLPDGVYHIVLRDDKGKIGNIQVKLLR